MSSWRPQPLRRTGDYVPPKYEPTRYRQSVASTQVYSALTQTSDTLRAMNSYAQQLLPQRYAVTLVAPIAPK